MKEEIGKQPSVIIVGGVAAGPKTGSRIIRLLPDAKVKLVEKGSDLSYAGCGLPYFISDTVEERDDLIATPAGTVRNPAFFRNVKNIEVFLRTEATAIDRKARTVTVRNLEDGVSRALSYDKLILATGATPFMPPLEGRDLGNVLSLQKLSDADVFRTLLAEKKPHRAVIAGAGLIGVEMAEALVEKGLHVTMVEMLPQILPPLDPDMAVFVAKHMEAKGVTVLTGTRVMAFRGDGDVRAVVTDRGEIPCDLVLVAVGVRPNVTLAKEAGLEIGTTGAIRTSETMQTSDPDIYAVGDCAETRHLVTGKPCYIPLGSTANKQGRVAASHLCGLQDKFPGVAGSAICKVFDFAAGRTGLGEKQAREAGYDVVTVLSPGPDRAHYYPGSKAVFLKMIADRKSRRLLGLQAVGPGGADKRIDIAATAITAGLTVDDVAGLDLCYAPPYAPAMDNIITAANIARNKLDGLFVSLTPGEVETKRRLGENIVLLDVRTPAERESMQIEDSVWIPLGQLRGRMGELPREREIITFCKISLRGYEAARMLTAAGFKRVRVMDGGLLMWPFGFDAEGHKKGGR